MDYFLYEYEYVYDDLHNCCICKTFIDDKYCVITHCSKKYYTHKKCLAKLLQ